MTELVDAVREWRDARLAFFAVSNAVEFKQNKKGGSDAVGPTADGEQALSRLANAECALMEVSRGIE